VRHRKVAIGGLKVVREVFFVLQIRQRRRGRFVMLSPQLLAILRSYWRMARRRTGCFPGVFPSIQPCRPPLGMCCVVAVEHHAALPWRSTFLCRLDGNAAVAGRALHP
jgi:hypothetical protein